jgi:uncharacterized protein
MGQNKPVSAADILNFLSDRKNYPEETSLVELRETHMSYVFQTDRYVYKMKKQVKYPFLDFSTPEKRLYNCLEELKVNRRLAPSVYIKVVALVQQTGGTLCLEGEGKVVEWLVKMVKLPADKFLQNRIESGCVNAREIEKLGELLAGFYQHSDKIVISDDFYIESIFRMLSDNLHELKHPVFAADLILINYLSVNLLNFVKLHHKLFSDRSKHLVEGHGDLKPEHICLTDSPVIIDALEFDKNLRTIDPLEELAYFALECEMLGAEWVGEKVIDIFRNQNRDNMEMSLINFYKCKRAVFRALLCYRHLLEQNYSNDLKWKRRGDKYLGITQKFIHKI